MKAEPSEVSVASMLVFFDARRQHVLDLKEANHDAFTNSLEFT